MALQPLQISLSGIADRATNAALAAIISALNAVRVAVAGGADGAWQDVATGIGFKNGWTNFAGPYALASYRLEVNGRVRLRGLLTSGSLATAAFTLPVGFRPNHSVLFPSDASSTPGFVQVDPTGDVIVGGGSNAFNTLDGITFGTN